MEIASSWGFALENPFFSTSCLDYMSILLDLSYTSVHMANLPSVFGLYKTVIKYKGTKLIFLKSDFKCFSL